MAFLHSQLPGLRIRGPRVTGSRKGNRWHEAPRGGACSAQLALSKTPVMVGFFGAITGLVLSESLCTAVEQSLPAAFRELKMKAFDTGFDFGLKHLEQGELRTEELEEPVEVRE